MAGKHLPVVIVERNGFPVRPVEGHAPSLSVVESTARLSQSQTTALPLFLKIMFPQSLRFYAYWQQTRANLS